MSSGKPKILVTGANGGLGSTIVTELLKFLPANEIAISVRNPEAAARFVARGVCVRRGDFDDSRGVPLVAARSLTSGFASRAKGELALVDPLLLRILDRPLRSVREVLRWLFSASALAGQGRVM